MKNLTDVDLFKRLCDPQGNPHGRGISIGAARAKERMFDHALRSRMISLGIPDFESRSDCDERQQAMLRNAHHATTTCNLGALPGCSITSCGLGGNCVEGCHYATLKRRIWTIESALPILAAHPGPHLAVTIVHPLWEAGVGKMSDLNIASARQWNYRRLKSLSIPDLLAIGGFEASLKACQE